MAEDMDMDALTEELTIQKVILDSLQGETFDGVEEEKREAEKEIERLKRLLRAAKRKEASSQDAVVEPQSSSWSDGESGGEDDQATPGPSSNTTVLGNPAAMSTPARGTDIWSQPGSGTLPSRKRDFDSTNLQPFVAQNKSRRATPVRAPNGYNADHFMPSSTHSNASDRMVEVIDLTGDDDDIHADFIAAQIKAEKRRDHLKRDEEIARQLASHGTGGSSSESNAFTRLMGSQLPPPDTQDDSDPEAEIQSAVRQVQTLPGAYPGHQDDPFNSRPAPPRHAPVPGLIIEDPSSASSSQFVSSLAPGGPSYRAQGPFPGQPPRPNASFVSQMHGRAMPSFGHTSTTAWLNGNHLAPGASRNAAALADIISRTSQYDYVNGVDSTGNPLSDRLAEFTDYFHDAVHDPRISDKELDELLENIHPDMDIPERNRDGTPAGLKSSLYHHQELALSWMKKMEEGSNKGGILADDMGLGKTISTLALILSRPATARPKTNLIVGPVALIRQWEEEIKNKTKLSHRLSVFLYHNKKATTEDLLKYDVVLTTYGTIASELKKLDKFLKDNEDRNIDFNDRTLATKCPLLHPKKAKFYRIILDEAQCIKNKDTQTAKACTQLKATYRWCLTGTPMMNSILELYSLLKFLRIKPYCKWEEFRQRFGVLFGRNGDPRHLAMKALRVLLKAIMLRRKKNSLLDGKPILKLPEKTETVVYAELSPEEHDFYSQLEKKSQVQFSKYLREGSIGKNYSNILVLLLRLRQACCHPHLNLDVDDVSIVSDEDKLEFVKALEKPIVERIKAIEAFECPICYDAVQSPSFFVPCGHDSCGQCLCRLAEDAAALNLQEGNESSKAKCPVCRGLFDPSKCFTYEAFQKVHMPECLKPDEDGQKEEPEDDGDSDSDSDSDMSSDEDVDSKGNLRGFIVDDDDFSGDEDKKPIRKSKKDKKEKKDRKGKKKAPEIKPSMLKTLRKEAYKNREAFKKYMRYLRKTWMPAAKVTQCMALVKEIEDSGEKTIIFSQWTLLLDLLEVAMHHEKMTKPVRYDGSMSANDRNIAAHNFRDKKDVKVMLVSLRAGNAGLNLTAASRVIIMDPFWNPYIEMQAIDRAYRIGQQKEVKVYRILTKETVEDRIVALQEKKKEIVEAALDESESMKIGRLSTNELKFLFNSR